MLSILQFNIQTKGNYATLKNNNIKYNPSENSINLKGNNVYITPNIHFTLDDLKDFNKKLMGNKIKDYKTLFISIDDFKQFIEFLNNKYGGLTMKTAKTYLNTMFSALNTNSSKKLMQSVNKENNTINKLQTEIQKLIKETKTAEDAVNKKLKDIIQNSLKAIKEMIIKKKNNRLTIKNLMKINELNSGSNENENINEINLETKNMVLTQNSIIKAYYNIIKAVELMNEERNKIVKEKKEIIKENETTIKKSNVVTNKSIIQELKNHIKLTADEIKKISHETNNIERTIKKGLNDIKNYETKIKEETDEMDIEKKDVLATISKKLEVSQNKVKEIMKKKQEAEINKKEAEKNKIKEDIKKYDDQLKILKEEQLTEQTNIETNKKLNDTISKQIDTNIPFLLDSKTKVIFDYNNNLITKTRLNKNILYKKRDTAILTIYNEKNKYILNNNIEIVKNIFFSYKTPFIIGEKKYIIYSLQNISRGYTEDLNFNDKDKNIQGNYTITLQFTLALDNGQFINMDFMNLSCMDKAKKLQKDTNNFFDISSNYITTMMKPIKPSTIKPRTTTTTPNIITPSVITPSSTTTTPNTIKIGGRMYIKRRNTKKRRNTQKNKNTKKRRNTQKNKNKKLK